MSRFLLCLLTVCIFLSAFMPSDADNLAATYNWKPVRIGGGGFVVGMVVHPRDPNVRYARTDVGEAYRWDAVQHEWIPMKVAGAVPSTVTTAPSPGGEQSIAVDPSNLSTVYVAFGTSHSSDVGGGTGINIYKSIDGGRHFTAGNLNVSGDANDDWRTSGERLAVDPHHPQIVYFGTPWRTPNASPKVGSGLYRSRDGGKTWSQVKGVPTDANIVNVLFSPHTAVIYAVAGGGDVFRSADDGKTWADICVGKGPSGQAAMTTLDASNELWVAQPGGNTVWKYAGGSWTAIKVAGLGDVHCIAVDPKNVKHIWAISGGSQTAMSADGGAAWTAFGSLRYANTLGWLPQTVGSAIWGDTRSNGGIYFDATGTLWIPQGQEGTLHYRPTGTETAANPPRWIIDSKGIEELVTQDVVLPKGGHGQAVVAVEDATGFVIPNPDTFSASQITLQKDYGLIAQGTGVAVCPNDSDYLAITSSNVYAAGPSLSGYSLDGGRTWQKFGSTLQSTDQGHASDLQAGAIAVGRRTSPQADGSDVHLVQLPVNGIAPVWSHDGGRTWHVTTSFPLVDNSLKLGTGYTGFWILALKQRPLYADPFTPDKFYLKLTAAPSPGGFYISTDGGETWVAQSNANLPSSTHHGQLAVNGFSQNDLWYADGWEGASEHGLWHSTDGGATFTKSVAFVHAITLSIGTGRGHAGDAPYAVYVYGQKSDDPAWGIFRSTDGGQTWDRISYYPTGIFDWPTCMAASPDTFGLVWVGFSGNSFVYGRPKQ